MSQIWSHLVAGSSGAIIGVALVLTSWPSPPHCPTPAPVVGNAEVSDLIARLRPLVKAPNGDWYENGLSIQFYGSSRVTIKMKMPNDDEYHSTGSSLQEAVSLLAHPSVKIKEALEGWKAPQP